MSEECNNDCENCSGDCGTQDPSSLRKPANPDAHIGKVFAVMSGKGGVGKSMVTAQLATAMQRRGFRVGILDADITGPSIPQAFGLHTKAAGTGTALIPCDTGDGMQIMSINLLLDDEAEPVIWRGPIVGGVVQQFWTDVLWNVDYLFVDMPPGTGDVPLSVFQILPIDGVVVVTSPQELVGLVVEKAIRMTEKMSVPMIGLIENMSYLACPDCGKRIYPFGEGKSAAAAAQHGIPLLAQLPIDPEISAHMDAGEIGAYPVAAFDAIAEKLA